MSPPKQLQPPHWWCEWKTEKTLTLCKRCSAVTKTHPCHQHCCHQKSKPQPRGTVKKGNSIPNQHIQGPMTKGYLLLCSRSPVEYIPVEYILCFLKWNYQIKTGRLLFFFFCQWKTFSSSAIGLQRDRTDRFQARLWTARLVWTWLLPVGKTLLRKWKLMDKVLYENINFEVLLRWRKILMGIFFSGKQTSMNSEKW